MLKKREKLVACSSSFSDILANVKKAITNITGNVRYHRLRITEGDKKVWSQCALQSVPLIIWLILQTVFPRSKFIQWVFITNQTCEKVSKLPRCWLIRRQNQNFGCMCSPQQTGFWYKQQYKCEWGAAALRYAAANTIKRLWRDNMWIQNVSTSKAEITGLHRLFVLSTEKKAALYWKKTDSHPYRLCVSHEAWIRPQIRWWYELVHG